MEFNTKIKNERYFRGLGWGGGAYFLNSTVYQRFPTSEFLFLGAKDLADSFELWHTKLFLLVLDNLRVVELQLRVASCELRVASCELRVASCELRVASCELRVASCELRVASYEL